MSRPVVLRPQREEELGDAADGYDAQRPGRGDPFLVSVEAVLSRVARSPERCARVHGEVRRALARRFPCCVFSMLEGEALRVIAVAHARRRPASWLERTWAWRRFRLARALGSFDLR